MSVHCAKKVMQHTVQHVSGFLGVGRVADGLGEGLCKLGTVPHGVCKSREGRSELEGRKGKNIIYKAKKKMNGPGARGFREWRA